MDTKLIRSRIAYSCIGKEIEKTEYRYKQQAEILVEWDQYIRLLDLAMLRGNSLHKF